MQVNKIKTSEDKKKVKTQTFIVPVHWLQTAFQSIYPE